MNTSYSEIKNYCEHKAVTLVVVSKTKSPQEILAVYNQGQRIFGENKVQELAEKHVSRELGSKDIQWHLVGHLQTNKVKFIAPLISLIHSVDSWKLLEEINKQAEKLHRTIDVLLQMHIAREETKFGLSYEEAKMILMKPELQELTHVCIRGLMGMATLTEDETQIRKEFQALKNFFSGLQQLKMQNVKFQTLSMGMSGDYKIAIEEGSTMVRIGSAIFQKKSGQAG